jgi:hypothetical protein
MIYFYEKSDNFTLYYEGSDNFFAFFCITKYPKNLKPTVQPKPSLSDNLVWPRNLCDEGTLGKGPVLVRQSALDPT